MGNYFKGIVCLVVLVSSPAVLAAAEAAPAAPTTPAVAESPITPPVNEKAAPVNEVPANNEPKAPPATNTEPAPKPAKAKVKDGQTKKYKPYYGPQDLYALHSRADLYTGLASGLALNHAEFLNSSLYAMLLIEWRQSRYFGLSGYFFTGEASYDATRFTSGKFILDLRQDETLGLQSFGFDLMLFAPLPNKFTLNGDVETGLSLGVAFLSWEGAEYSIAGGGGFSFGWWLSYTALPLVDVFVRVKLNSHAATEFTSAGKTYTLDSEIDAGNTLLMVGAVYRTGVGLLLR